MPRVRSILIAAVVFIVTAPLARDAAAADTVAHAKPSSFAPRGSSRSRVYGAPIQGPIRNEESIKSGGSTKSGGSIKSERPAKNHGPAKKIPNPPRRSSTRAAPPARPPATR